ncbi:MAG: hypothetical protein GQ526_01325 [Ardenticatenales bacterium]|nr:hypothetical protein [Ardenticatenales bacterium]
MIVACHTLGCPHLRLPPPATATQPRPPQEEATPEATLPVKGLAFVSIPPAAATGVTAAKADLADRLGMATEDILVMSIDAVEWSDSSRT